MRRMIWSVVRVGYAYVVKPLMFRLSPDTAHSRIIASCSALGRMAVVRWLIQFVFKRPVDSRLRQNYHGVEFNSPVGLSAGLDKNGEIVPVIASLGFSFGEVGSVTVDRCEGNPRPWYYRLPKSKSLVVNAGLANQGSKVIIKRLSGYDLKITKNFPIILSIAKSNSNKVVSTTDGINDYVTTVKRAKNHTYIKMLEINISCPNVYGGEPFTTPSNLELLLKAINKVNPSQPVFIKMPSNLSWNESKKLLDVVVKHKISGVTIANLAKDRSKVDFKDELPDNIEGNFSGRPAWSDSNELIRKTYLEFGDRLTIIGVGGIFSADDAYTKIKLGASLVEFITALIYCGPQLASEINDGLISRLKRDGYTHISQAIGVDAK